MASDAVRAKINEVVQTAFATAWPGKLVAFENTKWTQPVGAPWVHVAYNPGLSRRKDIGNVRTWRHMGVVIVNVMVPQDTGTKTCLQMCDTAFNALADRNFDLGADGYLKLCYAEKRNRGVVNGWFTYNVQVEYHHDTTQEA